MQRAGSGRCAVHACTQAAESLTAIEKELCESLELSDVIDESANKKARRVQF
jgi:hypothetical protein